MSIKREHQRIELRREKVRELSVKGHTQGDIAVIIHIALVIVNKDLQWLRQQAKENIRHYIDEYLPSDSFCSSRFIYCFRDSNRERMQVA